MRQALPTLKTGSVAGATASDQQCTPTATIAAIVPTLNEERVIERCLDELLASPHISQCIVCDGGSSDATPAIVRRCGDPRVRLLTGPKGRGPQMNHAAGRTDADCLLFHHADSSLDRDALTELACALDDTECQWGGFRHRFSDSNRRLAFISWLHNYRWRKTGVIYGDQSMFVRRAFFDSLGGFPDHELEDLAFSDAALARAPSRCLDSYVVTDSRKFRQMGELRGLAHVLSIIVRYEHQRRIGNEAFFRPYR